MCYACNVKEPNSLEELEVELDALKNLRDMCYDTLRFTPRSMLYVEKVSFGN